MSCRVGMRSGGLRSELRRAGRLRQITLEPLGAEPSAALLEQTLGMVAPSLRREVFDRTDGVPFFVRELGSALAASGRLVPSAAGLELVKGEDFPLPDGVRDAVLLRAAGLSDQARDAISTAAVAGQTFDPELVIGGCRIVGVARRVDAPRHGDRGRAGRMAFRHALVRDAFYGDIPWTRRVALHRAVAERLEAARRHSRSRR